MPSRAEARVRPDAAAPSTPSLSSRNDAGAFGAPPAAGALERLRGPLELALRAGAILLLAWLLWRSLQPVAPASAERASGATAERLVQWAARPPGAAELRLDSLPHAAARDLAVALRRSGVPVRWSGDSLPALAVAVAPVADPAGGAQVSVASGRGGRVAIGDAIGVVDSLGVAGAGATLSLASVAGLASAATERGAATAALPDSVALRRVLVLGRAGWEAKFAIAALEERGWTVDARLFVAPGRSVTQGSPSAPDTARYAAVVALDSTAAGEAARVARYVRGGGGLVLGADAARLPGFAAIAAAVPGGRTGGVLGALQGDDPRRGLALQPLRRLAPGALPLERRDSLVALAARRVALGRVVQAGYEETWRWRMGGGPGAEDAHRAWWARVVAAAAYAPVVSRGVDASGGADPAPRAALAAALGAPASAVANAVAPSREAMGVATFTVLALLLLLEWGSRRLRGAR